MPKKRRSPTKPPPKLPPKPPPPKSTTLPPAASLPPVKSAAPASSDLKASTPALASSAPCKAAALPGDTPPSGIAPKNPNDASKDSSCSDLGSKTQVLDSTESSSGDSAQAPPKPLWVDLLKGSGSMKKKGEPFLLESGELCVQIPDEVITRNSKRWESFIIGQFHGNLPSPGALHAIFNGIWSNRLRDITISRLGTRSVLIRIPNSITRQRVLGQGMWHIEGQTMFVAPWEPGLTPAIPEITEVPVWLEFRGVLPHFYSEEGFEHVASMLGHPVKCHPSVLEMTNMDVGKVLTIINPLIPLPEAVNVQFRSGEIHRVTVSCPWLPPICGHCEELGHSIKRCPTAPITCTPCGSTAHTAETCPKAKKGLAKDQGPQKSTSSKKTKGTINTAAGKSIWIEKRPQSETGNSDGQHKKKKKKQQKHLSRRL